MKPLEIVVIAIVFYIIWYKSMEMWEHHKEMKLASSLPPQRYVMPNLNPYGSSQEMNESMTDKRQTPTTANLIQSALEKNDNTSAMIVAAGLQDQVKSHREYNKHLNPGHSISSGTRSAFMQEMSGRTDINVHSGTAAFSQEYLKNFRRSTDVPIGPISSVEPSV